MTTKLPPLLACILLAVAPALRAADEPSQQPTKTPAAAERSPAPPEEAKPAAGAVAGATPSEVITLPAVQVTRSRIRQIDVTIKRIDKLIARERKQLRPTETDRALNNDRIARTAALFGGYSTSQRASVAAERVRLLESERELLEQMKAPMTRQDFLVVEKQIEFLRTTRRELDIVYR